MSVVQISRIQQRRGRKLTDGFPQLASGELGWAIDTQELYIGNGAVSEGAPYVGNSKVITEHDDILEYIALYQYKKNDDNIQTNLSVENPIHRSIQDVLDDVVSVRAFGVVGDGDTDDTVALQRAIDQLFLNEATIDNVSSRVVLYMEPGEYIISNEIKIPPYAHIVGSGIDSTIIKHRTITISGVVHVVGNVTTIRSLTSIDGLYEGMILRKSSGTGAFGTGTAIIGSIDSLTQITIVTGASNTAGAITFTAINENSCLLRMINSAGQSFGQMSSSLDRPRNILISNLTIQTDNDNSRIIYLDNTDSSLFDKVKFVGTFNTINLAPTSTQKGVEIRGTSASVCPNNILFHYCIFTNTGYGIYSNCDHNNITIDNSVFTFLYDGISLGGGSSDGAVNTKISNSFFEHNVRYGIRIKKGFGNSSSNNKFSFVGNSNRGEAAPEYPIIKFDTENNQSTGDYFDRNKYLRNQNLNASVAFIPNIQSTGMIYDNTNFHKSIDATLGDPIVFLRLPLFDSGRYVIDYVMRMDKTDLFISGVRTGSIVVSVDIDNGISTVNDNFTYVGDVIVENVEFTSSLLDINDDTTLDTLTINMYCPADNGIGNMNYTYRMLSQ